MCVWKVREIFSYKKIFLVMKFYFNIINRIFLAQGGYFVFPLCMLIIKVLFCILSTIPSYFNVPVELMLMTHHVTEKQLDQG